MDILFIFLGFLNSYMQYTVSPFTPSNKIVMLLVIFLQLLRTFKYLRIFRSFSPIVTMLLNVIWDLKQFMFIYFFLCAMLSLVYGTIGVNNL